jgi:hypothetical protein
MRGPADRPAPDKGRICTGPKNGERACVVSLGAHGLKTNSAPVRSDKVAAV